jgi:Protein of unknown function (DUF3147)
MSQLLIRFLIGGVVVSIFAVLGDCLKPKSFAGLFGAAPSVALATFGLTLLSEGAGFAASEARSMIAGAVAFLVYTCVVSWTLMHHKAKALSTAALFMPLWFMVAFGLWWAWLRGY